MTQHQRKDLENEHRAIEDVRARLLDAFQGAHAVTHINAVVDRVVADFDQARIREFVPMFVERAARDVLARRG